MKNKPLVSAIVPIYKVPENLLKQCIESLINQTLKNIEIILVDDESPDNCGKICDEYAQKDDRIIVIHQKNKGLCGARNSGAKKAKGEWVSFVDGDDFIEFDTYEKLYNSTINKNIEVVMFGYVKDYPRKSIYMNYDNYFENGKIYLNDEVEYIQMMILNYNANCAMAPTKFINRKFMVENNIFHDEILKQGAEGIEFNIRLFKNAKRVKVINECLYHYIFNDKSITTKHNEENHKMVLNCFEKIKTEINCNNLEIMEWFYNRMNHVILTTAISGYFSDSNTEKYSVQKKKYKKYLENELVKETLNKNCTKGLGLSKKITLFCIKYHIFFAVKIISKIRTKQKRG